MRADFCCVGGCRMNSPASDIEYRICFASIDMTRAHSTRSRFGGALRRAMLRAVKLVVLCISISAPLIYVGMNACGALLAGDSKRANQAPPASRLLHNPFAGNPDTILAGRKLYLRNCSHCHGPDAGGQGKAVNLLSIAIQDAPPGVLFWWVKNGNLRAGMPSWSHLPDERIWQIVTYLQSINQNTADRMR